MRLWFAFAFACCIGSAYSQPVTAPGPQQSKAERPAAKSSEAKPLPQRPEVLLPIPQPKNTQEGTENPKPGAEKPSAGFWVGWWHKFQEDPIVFFTLVLAISTILLWLDTRGLRTIANRQAKDTVDALKIARQAANAAETGFRLAERANLGIDKWSVRGVATGEKPVLSYKTINSGRSPAEINEIYSGYGISSEEKVPAIPPFSDPIPIGQGVVFPGAEVDMETEFAQALTEDEFQKVSSGEYFIFLYGKILYTDIFGWKCEVRFGAQYGNLGSGSFGVTFIKHAGYNLTKWTAPSQNDER